MNLLSSFLSESWDYPCITKKTDRGIYRLTVVDLDRRQETQRDKEIHHFLREEIEVGEW